MKLTYIVYGESMSIIISPRKIAKMGPSYVIHIPPKLGKKLHGKIYKVILEPIEVEEENE